MPNSKNIVSFYSLNKTLSQITLFSDTFTTNNSVTWSTSGAIGTYPNWSVNRSGNDFGARVNTSRLEITNDTSATANANGWCFAYRDVDALPEFNTRLSNNTGLITWEFNMRQPQTNPQGFAAGLYGVAFILAGTNINPASQGVGYAVALGQNNTTDPIRLIRYDLGLRGTITNIITSNTAGLTDFGTEYLSIRVIYNPDTDFWELLLRNDGASAFADPTTGTLVSQGSVKDDTHTGTAGLRYIGGSWFASTAATQVAFFDNVYLKKY